ncbi:MAG TPA: BatA domain-containing protein [Pirellulaceae bacterium]|nr:BatA domain-containing protein [Pirellulaceae bacterium]
MSWLNGLIPGLSGFMVGPALALLGALAVLSPILIHLLNKRKFKIVDWAAMDFLLDADKRNRRRVRLENLLLLLLRCLAMLLLGLLLARPFIPSSLTAGILDSAQFEHIVVLDDSLSTQVQAGNQSAFDDAKQRLIDMVRGFSKDRNDDSFTLILTSLPDQRQVNGVRVTPQSVDELVDLIKKLEPTDESADFPGILVTMEKELKDQPKNVNRLVYLATDLRKRDWSEGERAGAESDPSKLIARIAKATTGVYIIDTGIEDYKNLMITDIRPEGVLVAGVNSRFDVTIANYSSTEAKELVVKFKAGDALPLETQLERIPAGKTATVPFSFSFSSNDELGDNGELKPLDPVRISVEVVSSRPADEDRLLADSTAFFAARVVRGIPTLIVDGDPSANEQRSESYYLKHALEPTGPLLSGVTVDVKHEAEMETVSLSKYQVIFLCNVYRFSDKVLKDLETWVQRGGGLVIMPGDQVDERYYNEKYFLEGKGLSPLRLDGILGDETEEKSVNFKLEDANHPVLGVFSGQNNPALEMTKVFRWWGMSAAKGQLGSVVDVSARFNDGEQSIAMAEKKFGSGRVFLTAFPADADWHIWPVYGTYLISMEELVRYMAGDVAGSGSLRVGEPLLQTLDISDFKTDAEVRAPKDKKATLQAREPGAKEKEDKAKAKGETPPAPPSSSDVKEKTAGQTQWQLEYDETGLRGFYELQLSRNDGTEEKLLFAANADPTEGDLARADLAAMRVGFGDAPVKILSAANASVLAEAGSQRELWKYLLICVVVVLCGEQILAWMFGMKR